MGSVFARLRRDLEAAVDRDPAARNRWEVALLYPGLHAVWAHRASHWLWHHRAPFAARAVSQAARQLTGVEIHPAARLGERVFIDHGSGVVIGETTEVGDDVTIYQGVTLGGTSLEHRKRHPTVEDGVVVGAGAKVLGAITVGAGARIGANAVVIRSVAPDSVVVGVPGQSIASAGAGATDHGPAPHAEPAAGAQGRAQGKGHATTKAALEALLRRVEALEQRLDSSAEVGATLQIGGLHPAHPARLQDADYAI